MNKLANLIIDTLKKSSIYNGNEENPNIILFSDTDTFPEPPYVVVKPETGIKENTRSYRIIVHMQKGQIDELEDFTLVELDTLLLNTYFDDEKTKSRYKLYSAGWTDITTERLDNSYFMERIYYTPITIRN